MALPLRIPGPVILTLVPKKSDNDLATACDLRRVWGAKYHKGRASQRLEILAGWKRLVAPSQPSRKMARAGLGPGTVKSEARGTSCCAQRKSLCGRPHWPSRAGIRGIAVDVEIDEQSNEPARHVGKWADVLPLTVHSPSHR